MFGRKVPNANLGVLFKDAFQNILSILYREKDLLSLRSNLGQELYAFLFTLTLFYATHLKRSLRDAAVRDLTTVCDAMYASMNDSRFQIRQAFYRNIAGSGQIRSEWFLTDFPNQPDIRMYIAFGDCLFNADCVKDYAGASISLRGFDEKISFNQMMLQIQDIIQEYSKAISKI